MNCIIKDDKKYSSVTENTIKDVDALASEKVSELEVNQRIKSMGYSSVTARNFVKHLAANDVLKVMNLVRAKNKKITGSKKAYFREEIRKQLASRIAERIANYHKVKKIGENGKPTAEYKDIYKKCLNDASYIDFELSGKSPIDDNYVAWYIEANNNSSDIANTFFNEVFADGRLSYIRFENDDEFGEFDLHDAINAQDFNDQNSDENDTNHSQEADDDDMFNAVAAFEHSGNFSNFMMHVDDKIKTYFYNLPKLATDKQINGKFVSNRENIMESIDVMDAQACSVMLYRQGDFTNVDTMVESIKRIAERYKGFESFAKFAKDLEENPDFKYFVYCNFGKLVMAKQEIVVEDSNGSSRQSNSRSNPESALAFEFLNSIKSTSIGDNKHISKLLVPLKNSIDNIKDIIEENYNNPDVRKVIEDLTKTLNIYYPTMDVYSVSSYIFNNTDINGNVTPYINITKLYDLLKKTVEKSELSAIAYNDLQLRIHEVRRNRSIAKRERTELGIPSKINYDKQLQELYNEEYVDKGNNDIAVELARVLAPYSSVKIELNSRNVHGKLSSDVLNNNMVTNLMNTLQSMLNREVEVVENGTKKKVWAADCPLQHYKEFKFQSKQYDFSNILLEKRDENNNIINYGLFRRLSTGEVIPTEYAKTLLNFGYFNGATSFDNSKNILYSEMSASDYITSAFIGFFNSEHKVKDITIGNYFLRVPSDAPHNFVISAPRYSVNGLNQNGKINHKHPIFRQLRAAFEQELLDMAVAIDTIFETYPDGSIRRENGKPVFKPGFSNSGEGLDQLYKVYHYRDGSVIEQKNGKEVLSGRVFTSNKFVIFNNSEKDSEKAVRNYGQEIIDTLYMMYAGEAQGVSVQHIAVKKGTNEKVEDLYRTPEGYLFSEDFDNLVNSKIEEFIKDYCNEAIKRLTPNKEIIKAANANLVKDDASFNRLVSEFVLNHHLMYINFDDLFEGSTKFYKDSKDFLKRAKEVQGSGTPYGMTNYNAAFSPMTKNLVEDAALNSEAYKSLGIPQYDAFCAVTIKNTVRTSEEADPKNGILAKKLVEIFRSKGMTKAAAVEKAADMIKGFGNTKVNDAQSYITFDEWVRRIAGRGQLAKYSELIKRIQKANSDPNYQLDVSDIQEFIQVQKNFYYDHHYDPVTGIIAPRQIKNAEFVLVPAFIKGTQLERVYQLMVDNNIDQLNTEETSKAGKRAVLELFDDNGNLTPKNLKDFKAKAAMAKEYYSYNNLYTQQDNPQHMNAENKAGIQIMKKVLDNIDETSPLWDTKQKFITMYGEKVRRSFNKLMNDCGVERDENNNIILDENGRVKGLNYDKFYERFREEAERLGLDSNMNDYLTLDDSVEVEGVKISKMPNLLNNTSSKIESIAQAIFNSSITRQKLHGFHAAQVTNVGLTKFTNKNGQIVRSSDLHYHCDKDGKYQPYIEVKLPKSAFNFPKNPDGSYIMNDDQLRSQLEADGLDILIGYRIPTEGKQSIAVMKVVGFLDDAQGSTIVVPDDWVSQTGSDFDIDSIYAIQHRSLIDKKGNMVIPRINNDRDKLYRKYVLSNLDKEQRKEIWKESKLNQATVDELVGDETDSERIIEILEESKAEVENAAIEDTAEKYGLLSKEEYFAENDEMSLQSDAAIDNELVDAMLKILMDDESLEENLSRSNFDDITKARDNLLPKVVAAKRENRDSYNILDNADMQDDCMSGLKLKGFSVTRDNLCSVSNTVKGHLNSTIYTITYDASKYSFKDLVKTFGKDNVKYVGEDKKFINVTHKTFGYTLNNNKNIVGKILTSYSSQTTAHILDAVKEGNIPNVNDLTFAVYKTFVDLGSDYDTAVGFIMQPGITRIVNAYNANKSIYSKGNRNPIQQAIRSIASEVGIKVSDKKKNISIAEIVKKFSSNEEFNKAFKDIFGVNINIESIRGDIIKFDDFALPAHLLEARLKETDMFDSTSPVGKMYQLAFDLGIVLKYSQYSNFSKRIGDIARVCNPDKFGAKQSIYATAKVFEDIETLINSDDMPLFATMNDGREVSFLEAIYPGITVENGEDIVEHFIKAKDNRNSKYYPLYSFLKYSTAPSIVVNRQLFETQEKSFRQTIVELTKIFARGQYMTEKDYKNYERYILGYLYNNCNFVANELKLDTATGNFIPDLNSNKYNEKQRVYGFGHSVESTFEVKDINNPTEEELDEWRKLSPAQKVLWIQQHSLYGGVFATLRVDLRNANRTKKGAQTIEYVDNNQDIETVYQQFANAYYSSNPLIKYAAADLIKYAFIVEGFQMRRNAVNKIIQNAPLMESSAVGGTGIVQSIRSQVSRSQFDDILDLPLMYARGHNNMRQMLTVNFKDVAAKNLKDAEGVSTAIKYIDTNTQEGYETAYDAGLIYVDSYGNLNTVPVFKTNGKNPVTYRCTINDNGTVYMYPLNNLEPNEYGDWSANPDNNKYPHPAYYEGIINGTILANQSQYFKAPAIRRDRRAAKFDINNPTTEQERVDFERIVNEVISKEHEVSHKKAIYVWSTSLGNYIKGYYHEGSSEQIINGKRYLVSKWPVNKVISKYLEDYNRQVTATDSNYKDVVEQLRNMNFKKGSDDIYRIEPAYNEEPQEKFSTTTEEAATTSFANIKINSNGGDPVSRKIINDAARRGIIPEKDSIARSLVDSYTTIAEYVAKISDGIFHQLKNFSHDEKGNYYSITDDYSINIILNNPSERRRYLKLLLEAKKLTRQFGMYSSMNINSEDEDIQKAIKIIIDKVNQLNGSIVDSGIEIYAEQYLSKISNNPLVQERIINLLNGYYGSGIIEAMLGDTQEMASPLIQIITKDCMADIRSKEMAARDTILNFQNKIKELKDLARAEGLDIDWDNIVGADGRFIQKYTPEFVTEYNNLFAMRTSLLSTIDWNLEYSDTTAANVKNYLLHELKIKKFMRDNVQQELKDTYIDDLGLTVESFYDKEIKLMENMLNNYSEIYCYYTFLNKVISQARSHVTGEAVDKHWEDVIEENTKKLKEVESLYFFDSSSNAFIEKPSKRNPLKAADGTPNLIDTKEAVMALNNFKKKRKELYDEYYDNDEVITFRGQLNDYLRYIEEAEERDALGRPTKTASELQRNPRWVKAKEWLRRNARFVPDPNISDEVNKAFKVLSGNSKKSNAAKAISDISRAHPIYDEKGVIDGSKLTVAEQKRVKKAQSSDYASRAGNVFNTTGMISSTKENDEIYNAIFYKSLFGENATNPEFVRIVNGYDEGSDNNKTHVVGINDILQKYYNRASNTIDWISMTNDDYKKLAELYQKLDDLRDLITSKKVRDFIRENVEYDENTEAFELARDAAMTSSIDMNLWTAVNTEVARDDAGNVIHEADGTIKRIPRRDIYSIAKPNTAARAKKNKKGESLYVNEAKTEALKTIQGFCITTQSSYYTEELKKRRAEANRGEVNADGRTYMEWYDDNHVYDPVSHTMVPIRCWNETRLNDNNKGTWEANYTQSHRVAKEEYANENYVETKDVGQNYKGHNFDNTAINQNKYEKELSDYVKGLLKNLASVHKAQQFFKSGYMPVRSLPEEHDYKWGLKQLGKTIGIAEGHSGREKFDPKIPYDTHIDPPMPMTQLLRDPNITKRRQKIKYPNREHYNSDEDFLAAVERYKQKIKVLDEQDAAYHQKMLDRDWESVIEDFINKAAHYNAVQDNLAQLYYGEQILRNQLQLDTNFGRDNLNVDERATVGTNTKYVTRASQREYDQYTNWMRRLIFNQFKEQNNNWTKVAGVLQSVASANYMMMNIRGGIANVTLGETNILAEAWAKEYFTQKDYLKGKQIWSQSIVSYFTHMYKDTSSSVGDALIKFMNVVDFDEHTGAVTVAGIDKYFERVRNWMFSPQTMGEHFMQNGAMFSIMVGSKLYKNENPALNGKTEYVVKHRAEAIRDAHEDALKSMLTDAEREDFLMFIKKITEDENVAKEVAWFRRDVTNEYIERKFGNDYKRKAEYAKRQKQYEKEALEKFDSLPDMMSQFVLGDDGKLAFAPGSIMEQINHPKYDAEGNVIDEISDAYKIMGALKGRVISVNKKIHGVYDKLGAAQIEKHWWGSLAMQYHKHIYPGIMKRYRRHGYFNEERGTIEKGSRIALFDFLAIPIRKHKYQMELKENEVEGLEGIQNCIRNIVDFCMHIQLNWQMLPAYERANIRRNLGDVAGVLSALFFAIAIRAAGDDDEDGFFYNLALYEADRLASESAMFDPWGAISEAKKLWSSPVAVQSIINDILSSCGELSQMIIEGEDYDPYYHSGKYANQRKLEVYIKRRVPIYRGIYALEHVADDNSYYKLADNMLSIIPVKDIADWIKEK